MKPISDGLGATSTPSSERSALITLDPTKNDLSQLEFFSGRFAHLTHYLFRYPAKFHPPAVRALLDRYTSPGDLVLDPFCGSGTLLVEAGVAGRHAVGTDIDPVAVFVARAKVQRYAVDRLETTVRRIQVDLDRLRRSRDEYEDRMHSDQPQQEFEQILADERLWVPAIPNLLHWFRRFVVVDLARILATVESLDTPASHRMFLRLCFASIIRSCSNADPVPVSGLEVTAHMKKLDAKGRMINPFDLFYRAMRRALSACRSFREQCDPRVHLTVRQTDVTELSRHIRTRVDCMITSPPYHNAVEYYRRHQLEMYWLGFTRNHQDRLSLLPKYLGRPKVPRSHSFVSGAQDLPPLIIEWEQSIRNASPRRADAFRHYMVGMALAIREIAQVLPSGSLAVLVVGHSTWNGAEVPTVDLFKQIATPYFSPEECVWYPTRNRYMSFSRHNGAGIDSEHVLVFRRTIAPAGA